MIFSAPAAVKKQLHCFWTWTFRCFRTYISPIFATFFNLTQLFWKTRETPDEPFLGVKIRRQKEIVKILWIDIFAEAVALSINHIGTKRLFLLMGALGL